MTAAPGTVPPWRGRVNMLVGWPLFHAMYRLTVVGRERVPRQGPVLLVGNHVGVLDGPMLPGLAPRPTRVLVKQELFRGVLGWFLTAIGHIPVTRASADRSALHTAVGTLLAGGAVGIFPEGTRGRGDVASVQQGAAWLALQGGARVVPVAFLGTRASGASTSSLPRLRSRVVVEFGAPVDLVADPTLTGRQRLVVATELLRDTLAGHVRQAEERHQVRLPADARPPGR